SSQIYLETCLPSLGDCFVSKKTVFFSQTRRHLSEYVHLESELGFISFEEL
ncbi:putative asparagine-tRNA ligase, partial [Phakopsora pachyrhizi]